MRSVSTGRFNWNRVAGLVLFAVLAGILFCSGTGKAVFQADTAVSIQPDSIEDATLIIGTHLIYLGALNDSVYEAAKKSAQASAQNNIYYKSELAGGAWYEISLASSLEDIVSMGRVIDRAEIAALPMTHHTKSDGVTYDLRTNQPVSLYEISDPYDIENLEELSPVKDQYDLLKKGEADSLIKRNRKLLEVLFSAEVQSDTTKEWDQSLEALERYLKSLRDVSAPSEQTDMVHQVLSKADASRRYEALLKISGILEQIEGNITAKTEEWKETEKIEDIPLREGIGKIKIPKESEFYIQTELVSAVSESKKNLEDSLLEYQGNMLSEGTTMMTQAEYELCREVVQYAKMGNDSACNSKVKELLALSHLMEGNQTSPIEELVLLNEKVLPDAKKLFEDQILAGETNRYRQQKETNSSEIVLKNLAEENKRELDVKRSELQFCIGEKLKRLPEKDREDFIRQEMLEVQNLKKKIPEDDFKQGSIEAVDAYIGDLKSQLSASVKKSGNSELEQLQGEKQALLEERLAALDQENIREANRLEALIEAKEKEIQEAEGKASKELSSLSERKEKTEALLEKAEAGSSQALEYQYELADIESSIAVVSAKLSQGSVTETIQSSREEALKLIAEGKRGEEDLASIDRNIEAIGALADSNAALAGTALKEIYQKMASKKYLEDTNQYDSFLDRVEELVAEQTELFRESVTQEDALRILEETLGGSFSAWIGNSGDQEESGTAGSSGTGGSGGGTSGRGQEESGTAGSGSSGGTSGRGQEESGTAGSGGSGGGTSGRGQEESGTTGEAGKENEAGISGETEISAILALLLYEDQTKEPEIKKLAVSLLQSFYHQNHSYIFQTVGKNGSYYVPIASIASYAKLRYIWNENQKKGVLSSRNTYYSFSAFSSEVGRNGDQTDQMPAAAVFHGMLYIPEDYVKKEFGCEVYRVPDTGYSLLTDSLIIEKAKEVYEVLLEKGGR